MAIFGYKEADGSFNYCIVGPLVRDPELNPKGDRVKFSVAYGKKKYMNVQAYLNTPAGELAGCLEKGDVAAVVGIYESWGDRKQYGALKAELIVVQTGAPAPTQTDAEIPEKSEPAESAADSSGVDWSELGEPDFELSI